MSSFSTRRLGPWLVLLCLGAAAGTLHWAWKRMEPRVRYHQLCDLILSNRKTEQWSQEDRALLSRRLGWFQQNAPQRLVGSILDSLVSRDPDEREAAVILAANIQLEEYVKDITYWTSPMFPPAIDRESDKRLFGINDALGGNAALLSRLLVDERPLVRTCGMDLISHHLEPYRKQLVQIAMSDPEIDLRCKATQLAWGAHSRSERRLFLERIAKDPNPRLRLLAAGRNWYDGDVEAFKEFLVLITDPSPELPAKDRLFTLQEIEPEFPSLAGRLSSTRLAIREGPGALRIVAEQWKAWLQTKEFEEFAAELEKRR